MAVDERQGHRIRSADQLAVCRSRRHIQVQLLPKMPVAICLKVVRNPSIGTEVGFQPADQIAVGIASTLR